MAEIVVQVVLVLAEKVIIFLDNKFDRSSTNNVHVDVEKARYCLEMMKAYLSDHNSEKNAGEHQGGAGPQVLHARVKQVQEIAYQIEDALDKFLLHVHHQFHSNRVSQKVHSFMKFPAEWQASREFSSTIKYIMENKLNFLGVLDSIHQVRGQDQEGRPSSSSISPIRSGDDNLTQYGQFLEEEEIMGFEEPKEKLIKQLVEGDTSRPLTIISVVGFGGSGKTTLMKNVFKSKEVQQCFHCHAWIDVPRGLSPRQLDELLLNMLSKLDPKGRRQEQVLHADPKAQLRRLLEQKRFLVVLDNLWSKQDLEGIINALPNGLPASAVVITTRNSDIVASWKASSPEHFHDLSDGISSGNAWILFCKKAFHNNKGKCPPELEVWARKIVKKCEGLPLAISAVGTLLATKRANPLEWKKLHDSLGSNLSAISQMLQPSYKDLPSHLKTCFLYFSMFPEDYSISRERLIRLWVAEGFVLPIRGARMTMEEVAEGYLDDLIGRNLVHASSREVDGRVRSCRVLNLVLEFTTAKVENFITILWEADRSSTTQGEKIRRLTVHNVSMNNFSRSRDLRCTRTLLVCGQGRIDSELERVLQTFKFLRVLDLQGVALEEFPNSVFSLTLLRYISLRRTNIKKVPESIKKLGFLETLDLKHTLVTSLPKEIFYLHNLRHLLVYRYDVKNYVTFEAAIGVEISAGNIGALSSIQKLSLIQVKNNTKILKGLGELTSLKKLGLTDLKSEDGRELCNAVEKMENLLTLDVRSRSEEECLDLELMRSPPSFLQRLYLKGRLKRLPQWIPLLLSVTKIGLKWSKLNAANSANPLEALQALPSLMQLDLVDYCNGEVLEFKGKMFKKLKILNIEQFDQLNMMIVENGAMPMLKKLTMSKCKSLELLPLGIEGLRLLDELLLYDMPEQFIAKLQRNSEFREMVEHIRIIHSWHLRNNESFTGFQNLS